MNFPRPDPEPSVMKIFHQFYDYFQLEIVSRAKVLKPDPDPEKFENRIQAKTPDPDPKP